MDSINCCGAVQKSVKRHSSSNSMHCSLDGFPLSPPDAMSVMSTISTSNTSSKSTELRQGRFEKMVFQSNESLLLLLLMGMLSCLWRAKTDCRRRKGREK